MTQQGQHTQDVFTSTWEKPPEVGSVHRHIHEGFVTCKYRTLDKQPDNVIAFFALYLRVCICLSI